MKRFLIGTTLWFAAMAGAAGPSNANGYYDSTGQRRGVAEFRAAAQACASTWAATHQHPATVRPKPVARVNRPSPYAQNARTNFIMNTCLPAYGWRPTSS